MAVKKAKKNNVNYLYSYKSRDATLMTLSTFNSGKITKFLKSQNILR